MRHFCKIEKLDNGIATGWQVYLPLLTHLYSAFIFRLAEQSFQKHKKICLPGFFDRPEQGFVLTDINLKKAWENAPARLRIRIDNKL